MSNVDFTPEQKQYLEGFVAGTNLVRGSNGLKTFPSALGKMNSSQVNAGKKPDSIEVTAANKNTEDDAPGLTGPLKLHAEAQNAFLAKGDKLCAEEKIKREKNPFTMREEMERNVESGTFPQGGDVFRYKFHGLFHVSPAQNSFMCRMRFPGGIVKSYQFREVANLARELAGGYCHITTRANLQLREIKPEGTVAVLDRLTAVGIVIKGSGADNVRNITGNPLSGIDPTEIIETQPYCLDIHHAILNRPEMYGLPRKFNIAYDGGGQISVLEDTNDIGFDACIVPEGKEIAPGIYFRLQLGGITGHKDFARDTEVLLKPEECSAISIAILRVFLKHGDRTNRQKARLKYVLDAWGFEKFLVETEKEYGKPLRRFPVDQCLPRKSAVRGLHVGVHPQKQAGKFYMGIALTAGHMSPVQMDVVADLSEKYGTGTIRLTVWQNLIISDINADDVGKVQLKLQAAGLSLNPHSMQANVIACTGNSGCKYAASNTKHFASRIIDWCDDKITLDQPLNIHLTGCHHSCAQHYIGDIGLIAAKVQLDPLVDNSPEVEGFHLYLGGGYGDMRAIGKEFWKNIPGEQLPILIEKMLESYHEKRHSTEESFAEYSRRINLEEFKLEIDQRLMEKVTV